VNRYYLLRKLNFLLGKNWETFVN